MLTDTTIIALNQHIELYERAAIFPGRPRERLVAMGEADELFYRRHTHQYRALQVVRVAAQLGHTLNRRQDVLFRCECRTVLLVTRVIRDAIEANDLNLQQGQTPEELAFSIWALVFGIRSLMNTAVASSQLGVVNGYTTVCRDVTLLLDAIGWRPLSRDWDYNATRQRVRESVFSDE